MDLTRPINVYIVEDNEEYRHAIARSLKNDDAINLTGQFGTAELALRELRYNTNSLPHPDLILLDLNLPGMSGHSSIPWFRQQAPDAEIIVLTQSDKEKDVMKAVHLGASGYLLKTALIDNIRDSIINVHKGGGSLDPKIAKMLMSQLDYSSLDGEEINITTREVEILKLLAEGLQKKEIATHLDIAIATVNTHIKNIYIKLDVTNAPGAVNKAHKMGLFKNHPQAGS